jgi:hypothetical protein
MKYIIIFFVVVATSDFAQTIDVPIKTWKSHSIPKNKDTLISYNWSSSWWVVYVKNEEIYTYKKNINIKDALPFDTRSTQEEKLFNISGERSVLKVDNGYLVGMNYGEWGGDFSWYSRLGGVHKKISGDQILKFLVIRQEIFALNGYGDILQVEKTKAGWSTKNYIKFPIDQNLISFALDSQGNFIVITNSSLLKIDKEKKITTIIENGFWLPYLHPTSMVIVNDIVYAGMPMGVFKYNLNTQTKEWLMPQ